MEDSLVIRIKRYASDGLTVASASYTFAYPEGMTDPSTSWMTLRCTDDEETVSISINDCLICTVQLEEPGVTYESDGTGQAYYGRAILCDAQGTKVLTVENTRLNSAGSQIALTTRNQTFAFDNIHISFDEYLAQGSRTESPLASGTETLSYTPDTRLLDTLTISRVVPEYGTEKPTEMQTEGPVEPDTSLGADTGADTRGESAISGADSEPEMRSGCSSSLATPTALIAVFASVLCGAAWGKARARAREKEKQKNDQSR
jgi:hypothetical protein